MRLGSLLSVATLLMITICRYDAALLCAEHRMAVSMVRLVSDLEARATEEHSQRYFQMNQNRLSSSLGCWVETAVVAMKLDDLHQLHAAQVARSELCVITITDLRFETSRRVRLVLWLTTLWLRHSMRISTFSLARIKQHVEEAVCILEKFCGRTPDQRRIVHL